ncbi:hypothetical protein PAMA_002213 [Pampus argenteus]
MGQLFSSEEELSDMKNAIGHLLYDAMLEGEAVPHLGVVHPRLLTDHNEDFDSRAGLQEQLQQLQGEIGNRAPTYLRDLIGRLSAFSDEPRLAGLLGLVVTMVMDMAYTSSKQSSGVKGKPAQSSSGQRVWELQEVMEEYLKRVRINLNDKNRLIQDSFRLEAQLSLTLTQLKTCLLAGDCDSRSLRHWASGAAFHTQMLVQLAGLEDKAEPLAARAALEQYKDDLTQIIPAYRRYKSNTVCVVKCRGGLLASCSPPTEGPEDGSMTGLTITDRETGKSVTIPLSSMEADTGTLLINQGNCLSLSQTSCITELYLTGRKRSVSGLDITSAAVSSTINLDLITSDQYAQAYLDHLFSEKGPVAELENYFSRASDNLRTLRTGPGCTKKSNDGEHLKDQADGINGEQGTERRKDEKQERGGEETEEWNQRDESLRLSIVETQAQESLHSATSTQKQ